MAGESVHQALGAQRTEQRVGPEVSPGCGPEPSLEAWAGLRASERSVEAEGARVCMCVCGVYVYTYIYVGHMCACGLCVRYMYV